MSKKLAFCVYDSESLQYWKTPKGKSIWEKKASAKNAWNANGLSSIPFNQQCRFEVHEFELTGGIIVD